MVVGGGPVALRKVELLRKAGARVCVVAPEPCPELERIAVEMGAVTIARRGFAEGDVDGAFLVFAATGDRAVNAAVAAAAQARATLVNVVDDPELCTFIMPSIVDRSPVIAAVSTGGASPVLARTARALLERMLPPRYGELARFAAAHRERVKSALPTIAARREFWERLFEGRVGELVIQGELAEAERALTSALRRPASPGGQVILLGAGTGEVERLTLLAARLLAQADCVFYEPEVGAVVELARRDAERRELAAAGGGLPEDVAAGIATRAARGERVCLVRAGEPYGDSDAPDLERLRELDVPVRVL